MLTVNYQWNWTIHANQYFTSSKPVFKDTGEFFFFKKNVTCMIRLLERWTKRAVLEMIGLDHCSEGLSVVK